MEERLQKYMAKCGVASRRKCEELIINGRVKVNDEVIITLGAKVIEGVDIVKLDDNIIKPEERKVYIMLNKPEGYITSVKDEKGRETILDIVKIEERIYPIGRLDYDSSGLILLTNDGDIYNKIIHPRVKINKKYIVSCKGEFSKEDIFKFEIGIDIGGYITAPAKIKVLNVKNSRGLKVSTVEVIIHEGKNRQIRKMCSALNHSVITLKRVAIGEIKLQDLQKGQWRELTAKELEYINTL
ncbi:pseudouridine synthase [Clostridium carnis]